MRILPDGVDVHEIEAHSCLMCQHKVFNEYQGSDSEMEAKPWNCTGSILVSNNPFLFAPNERERERETFHEAVNLGTNATMLQPT